MKRMILSCWGLFLMSQLAFAQTAMEKAEKRLADLLAPGNGWTVTMAAARPVAWKESRVVEDFSLPVTPVDGVPVRLALPAGQEVKPRPVAEGQPLVAYREEAATPTQVKLPTKPLIKLPSIDVNTPLPIPILAQPTKDRASLAEPAFEASLDAALQKVAPARARPVPFTPLNLPDPFEYVRTGQLRNPPGESATPPVIPLTRPTK